MPGFLKTCDARVSLSVFPGGFADSLFPSRRQDAAATQVRPTAGWFRSRQRADVEVRYRLDRSALCNSAPGVSSALRRPTPQATVWPTYGGRKERPQRGERLDAQNLGSGAENGVCLIIGQKGE